jgi:hypothetical protein
VLRIVRLPSHLRLIGLTDAIRREFRMTPQERAAYEREIAGELMKIDEALSTSG